jgi:hypothetical protein
MPNRHTDRERWEVLISTILLAYRPMLFVGGVIFLIYAGVASFVYFVTAGIALGLAAFLFMLVFSDQATFYLARFGAWLATVGKNKN